MTCQCRNGCDKSDKCDCNCECKTKNDMCLNRNYLCKSAKIKRKLAELNDCRPYCDPRRNKDECKYRDKHYDGSYTKGLNHDTTTGHITRNKDYENLVHAITHNCQKDLALVQMAPKFEIKFVDPLASLSAPLIGADQCKIQINAPPRLCSKEGAAEMVELYSHLIARDVPFINYDSDTTINKILGYMNVPDIVNCLPDYSPKGSFTTQNIFRGPHYGDQYGPYISQLLYLNVPTGALTIPQKYEVYPTKMFSQANGLTVEWGRNNVETINIQNAIISGLPSIPPRNMLLNKYIFDGRSLAEAVHNDPIYQFFYQASLILSGLGASPNPSLPVYPNQQSFVTNGGPSVQCLLADVAGLALKHAWYWKWQVYRKLRPEAFGLWIDNVKNGRVPNSEYEIHNVVLNSLVLDDVKACNASWGFPDSYTLNMTYREGSPLHPAFPSGHASIAGACVTVIKMFYDCEQLWSSLPGLNGTINRRIVPVGVNGPIVQADQTGDNLVDYNESDVNKITVAGELNKLASNIAFGRNWAGIHYRTDATQGNLMGEQVAIEYMKDILSTWVQNNLDCSPIEIKFKKFDGSICVIKPRVCDKCKNC